MTPERFGSEEGFALAGLVTTFLVTAAWWALALWPVADSPEWLARTRYVCFGVGDSGLPDAGGWIGLIGGPLGMLGIVLAGWGKAVQSVFRRARRSLPLAATLSVLAIGTLVMVTGAGLRVRQAHARQLDETTAGALPPSTYPRLDRAAPSLELTAHDGRTLSLASLRGRPVLLTFAYAHCTTVCPLIVRDVLSAQKLLACDTNAPIVLVITLDPWRDTPSRLSAAAEQWNLPPGRAWLLGGSVAAVTSALGAWNVPFKRDEQTGEVTHPALVYIIDAQGRIAFASSGGAETLAELARRLDRGD